MRKAPGKAADYAIERTLLLLDALGRRTNELGTNELERSFQLNLGALVIFSFFPRSFPSYENNVTHGNGFHLGITSYRETMKPAEAEAVGIDTLKLQGWCLFWS